MKVQIRTYKDGIYRVTSTEDAPYIEVISEIKEDLSLLSLTLYFHLAKNVGETGGGEYLLVKDGQRIRDIDPRTECHLDAHYKAVEREQELRNL